MIYTEIKKSDLKQYISQNDVSEFKDLFESKSLSFDTELFKSQLKEAKLIGEMISFTHLGTIVEIHLIN